MPGDVVPADAGCRVDASGAANAAAALLDRIADCDLLIVSKFGKLEVARQGLFDVVVAAASADRPLLTSVSEKHLVAWQNFAPEAVLLPADADAIDAWRQTVLRQPLKRAPTGG